MIARWMRLGRKCRPWVVAVALAAGSAVVACDEDCGPLTFYGPGPTCTTDDDCVRTLGPGAWCGDEDLWYDDGCGNRIHWGNLCHAAAADADADADVSPDDVVEVADEAVGEDAPTADVREALDDAADADDYYPPPPYGPIPSDADD